MDVRKGILGAVFSNSEWQGGGLNARYRKPLESIAFTAHRVHTKNGAEPSPSTDCPVWYRERDEYRTFFAVPTRETQELLEKFDQLISMLD